MNETTKRRAIFRLCNRIAERTEGNRAIWVTWGCELLGLPGDYSPDLVVKAHNAAVRVDNEAGHAGATAEAIIGALTAPAPVVATRVTMHEAKRHFEAGGAVLVSEYGHEPTQTVTAITTTHDRTRTTWDALAADVKEWRNRYPNQRFYIVPTVDACTCSTDEDACPDHPGDPCPACGRRSGHDDGCTDDDAAACEGFGNLIEMGTPDDETERDDIDVDTLDGMRCAAAMLASVVAAVRAEVAVRSAEFEEQHYGNADESLEAARCAGNLNALRWLESLVTAPIR